jgi:uncharacterized protein
MKEKIIGIHHGSCIDGTTAAAVLLKKYSHAKIFPFKHSYTDKDVREIAKKCDKNTTLYILDFSLRKNAHIQTLLKKVKSIINIDHHIGVNERLEKLAQKEPNFDYIFNNNNSGASLTWIYFYGKKSLPTLIKYVEKNDIRKGKRVDKDYYVTSFLSQFVNKPDVMKKYVLGGKKALTEIMKKGKLLADYNNSIIADILKTLRPVKIKIGIHAVLAYNPPEFLRSHIGAVLYKQTGKAVCVFNINGNDVRLHFRSENKNTPSALDLAQTAGGNGHRNAAGAHVPLKKFLNMIQV